MHLGPSYGSGVVLFYIHLLRGWAQDSESALGGQNQGISAGSIASPDFVSRWEPRRPEVRLKHWGWKRARVDGKDIGKELDSTIDLLDRGSERTRTPHVELVTGRRVGPCPQQREI